MHLGFTQGVFTLDPDRDLEGVLITQGWTQPCDLTNTWYFYQEWLRAFMSHYQQVCQVLAQFQRREDHESNDLRLPSVVPTTFTDPGEVHQAFRRHFNWVMVPFELGEPESEPATPAQLGAFRHPPALPRLSVHIVAQGPADQWCMPWRPKEVMPSSSTVTQEPVVDPCL